MGDFAKPLLLIASRRRHATHSLIINGFRWKLLATCFTDEAKFDVIKMIRLPEIMHNVCGIFINLLTYSMEQSSS